MSNALIPLTVEPIPRTALRPEEAAASLGVSRRWLDDRTKAGEIPHVRIGGVVLYSVDGLRDWLAQQGATNTHDTNVVNEAS